MKEIAEAFGSSLDQDNFQATRQLLSEDCTYDTGSGLLTGPEAICNSYEQNMIEGRKKLDELVWGKCRIEELGEGEYFVHFTDYLTQNGKSHTFRCKQKVTVHDSKIVKIVHHEIPEERAALNEFYRSVGLL